VVEIAEVWAFTGLAGLKTDLALLRVAVAARGGQVQPLAVLAVDAVHQSAEPVFLFHEAVVGREGGLAGAALCLVLRKDAVRRQYVDRAPLVGLLRAGRVARVQHTRADRSIIPEREHLARNLPHRAALPFGVGHLGVVLPQVPPVFVWPLGPVRREDD